MYVECSKCNAYQGWSEDEWLSCSALQCLVRRYFLSSLVAQNKPRLQAPRRSEQEINKLTKTRKSVREQ